MKKSFIYTYVLLLLLTLTTALISMSNVFSRVAVLLIIGISAIKFLLVAFQFMELKKANSFWKNTLVMVLTTIIILLWYFF
jgi:heme/copper-type cytochrome/quinol oxidase subunit 4